MRDLSLLHLFVSLGFILGVNCLPEEVLALGVSYNYFQGPKRPTTKKEDSKTVSNTPSGPKRPTSTIKGSEAVRVITKTEFIRVIAKPNQGYLSVVAVPAATVTLTPLFEDRKKVTAIKQVVKDKDGSLNLINLHPGKYKIVIEHEDYDSYTDTIQVDPASPDTFVASNKMVSKYGAIRIGGAPADAKVFLDNSAIPPSGLISENQNTVIAKVPVGKHSLRVSKPGYVDFTEEIDVLPGKSAFVSAQLDLAKVTLNLNSEPGARVYVGSEEKATIPSDTKVAISLAPGRHTLRVLKDGYQEWRKELTVSLANNPVTERVELIPIPNSAEGGWQPQEGPRKWHPQPAGWKFAASGAFIKGDQLVLFDTESSRDFNTYRDFKLEFDVTFANGKGMAWVARAKDANNYYLFEIAAAQAGAPTFHFYICRNGKLEWRDSQRIVEKIDKPGDSFHIIFEARGNRFDTRMTIASAPSTNPHLIGIFQDDSFTYGGIGFRGKDQSESLIQTFFVIPLK